MVVNVRPMVESDVDEAGLALARSFEHDPFFAWLYGESGLGRMTRSFRAQLRVQFVPRGLAYIEDGRRGAALWGAPGRGLSPTFWESVRLIPAHLYFLPPRRMLRTLRTFRVMDSHHPAEPHVFLSLLGVDPQYQRSGVGHALLNEGLDRAEAAGLPVYLQTGAHDNVPYYERFGFQVTGEFDIPFRDLHFWEMYRPAAATRL